MSLAYIPAMITATSGAAPQEGGLAVDLTAVGDLRLHIGCTCSDAVDDRGIE